MMVFKFNENTSGEFTQWCEGVITKPEGTSGKRTYSRVFWLDERKHKQVLLSVDSYSYKPDAVAGSWFVFRKI